MLHQVVLVVRELLVGDVHDVDGGRYEGRCVLVVVWRRRGRRRSGRRGWREGRGGGRGRGSSRWKEGEEGRRASGGGGPVVAVASLMR